MANTRAKLACGIDFASSTAVCTSLQLDEQHAECVYLDHSIRLLDWQGTQRIATYH